MTNNEFVILLFKRKDELRKICNYHNIYYQVDDILQELYVKLLFFNDIDRYVKNGEPNLFIIFAIIRNIIFDYRKSESRFVELDFDMIEDDETDFDKYDFVLKQIDNIDFWFDKTIIQLYVNEGHTIRSLSSATKIGPHVIQKVFRRFKLECVENLKKIKK